MQPRARPIIEIGDTILDHDELAERAAFRASRIAGADAVAVVAHPSLDTVVTILAALEARTPVVPMSPDAGPLERDHVLRDSGASLLADGDRLTPLATTAASAPAADLVLYTSGTTGKPKGVPISPEAVAACIDGLADAWGWTPDDVLVHGLPLHHVHGLVLGILGPIHVGSGIRHTGRPTPGAYAAAGGTLYFGVPTVWSRVAADPTAARAMASARLLVSGSAALPAPVFDALLAQAGQAPVERYGMTETLITLAARADEERLRGSVGRPLRSSGASGLGHEPTVATRIVDDHGSEVDRDELGELQVRGGTLFSGYLHRPDATAASFTDDGWFRTGDVASADAEGRHRILGRASSDLIKTGGYRVGAGEVEDALLSHDSVSEAAVVGEPDDDLGQRIVAYVVADGTNEADLIAFVANSLSIHKRPRSVRFLDALPRNAMGKVDKKRLHD